MREPAPEQPPSPRGPAAAPVHEKIVVGDGVEVPLRDPLTFIKSEAVPVLSSEKKREKASPLEFLIQARSTRSAALLRHLRSRGTHLHCLH